MHTLKRRAERRLAASISCSQQMYWNATRFPMPQLPTCFPPSLFQLLCKHPPERSHAHSALIRCPRVHANHDLRTGRHKPKSDAEERYLCGRIGRKVVYLVGKPPCRKGQARPRFRRATAQTDAPQKEVRCLTLPFAAPRGPLPSPHAGHSTAWESRAASILSRRSYHGRSPASQCYILKRLNGSETGSCP
jgi:hypothetical protein